MLNKLSSLRHHQGFIRYFKNTSWMMGEQFLRIIAGLFVGIWVARYLGPEQFGLFNYVLAFTAILGSIARFGLDGILVRELVNHPEKRDIYLGTTFWLKVIGAFIVMGLMAAVIPFTSNDATTNLFIFIIASGFIFQSFEVVEFYFQSQVLAKIVSICKITQLALSSIIKIYFVLTKAELVWFVLVTAFDTFSLAISYFIAYQLRKNPLFYKRFNLGIAKELIRYSWPLIISSLLVAIQMRLDQIMIKEMLSEYELGIYSAAIRLSEFGYFMPILICSSLFPAILSAKKSNHVSYIQRLQKLYIFMIWTAIITASIITIFSQELINILYGRDYEAAGSVLKIHIWASVFVYLGVVGSKWILSENLQQYTNYFLLIGLTANFLLNLLLIPLYGILGAALAIVIAQAISSYLSPFLFRKTRLRSIMATKAIFPFIK